MAALSLNSPSRRKDLALATLCGLLGGLASAVKITGFLVVGAIYVLLCLLRAVRGNLPGWRVAGNSALFAAAALLCIYALNPFYWPDVGKIRPREAIAEVRRVVVDGDRLELDTTLGSYLSVVRFDRAQIVEQLPQLYNLMRPLEFPVQFLRWKRLADRFASTQPWPGPRLEVFWRKMRDDYAAFPASWVFLLLGIAICLKQSVDGWRRGRVSPALVPVLWLALCALLLLTAMPRAADRYFLPVVIAERILLAAGLWATLDFLRRRLGWR